MPTIYQGLCSHCGHSTPLISDGYGAVVVDEPIAGPQHEVSGAVIASDAQGEFATAEDPRFVVLAHPLEDYDLARTGYSWSDLLWQGRYVSVTNMICGECGTVFPRRQLAAPGGIGCLSSLTIGFVTGLALGAWKRSVLVGFVAWYLVTLAAMILIGSTASLYLRFRFAERSAWLVAERACQSCHADNAESIDRAKSMRCPTCRKESMRFVIAGIS